MARLFNLTAALLFSVFLWVLIITAIWRIF